MGQPLRKMKARRDASLRELTFSEIEEQIASCVAEVAAPPAWGLDPCAVVARQGDERPRALSSGQLVRSMRKYIVYN